MATEPPMPTTEEPSTTATEDLPTPELKRSDAEINPRDMSLETKIQFAFERLHGVLYSDHKPDSRYRESTIANSVETFLMVYERRNDTATCVVTDANNQVTITYNQGRPLVFSVNNEWHGYER